MAGASVCESTAMKDHSATTEDGTFFAKLFPQEARVCMPELSLAAAVFEDAVRCAQRARRDVTHRQASEAFEWIASERRDWPFAFVSVCDVLGVDAKAVRAHLHVGGESDVPERMNSSL